MANAAQRRKYRREQMRVIGVLVESVGQMLRDIETGETTVAECLGDLKKLRDAMDKAARGV